MHVGVTTFGGDGGKSGISRYIVQLLAELSKRPWDLEADVLLYEEEKDIFLPADSPFRAMKYDTSFKSPVKNILWHQTRLGRLSRQKNWDVLFLPAANRRLPLRCPIPTLGTVHDFSAIHMDGKYDRARMFYIKKVLPMLVRRLTRVVTVSESSKRDIVEFAGVPEDDVDVIPLGVRHDLFHPNIDDRAHARARERHGLKPPYILYTSRLEHPGKNHVNLIRAFDQLKTREGGPWQLVLAGSDWLRSEAVHEEAERAAHGSDIKFTGFVDDEDLPAIYAGADLLCFPSLYEGFGLPILEAMACGTAVACSNVSSMPEVGGDTGLLFDPHDVDAIDDAMSRILTDASLRESCRRAGLERAAEYTWEKCADRTLESLRLTCGEPIEV